VFPPQTAPALSARTPDSRHVDVPEAGHSVYFERAAEFNRLLRDFLRRL
jgi:pimeloyl-ACP methyl ester carboxylesterase